MDQNKNYSLYVDGIEDAVNAFVSQYQSLGLTVTKPNATVMVCHIEKGKTTGILNFHFKKNGLVSMSIQGAPSMNTLCDKCCDDVIQRTAIPNSLRKNFTLREIKRDNFDYFKADLTDTHGLSIVVKASNPATHIRECFDVLTGIGVKVTCTVYDNDTFLMQGNVTTLYVTVMTEALRWLVNPEKISKITDVITLNNTTKLFSENINVLIPNISVCGDTDGVIDRMVLTTVRLFNSGVIVEDYGSFTFGVLKALEGVLKLRLSEDLGPIDKLGNHYDFDPVTRRHRINHTLYDSDVELKKALNKGYNEWVSSRHSSFHADDQISTSTLLSYEQAVEVFQKALECINSVCDNWN